MHATLPLGHTVRHHKPALWVWTDQNVQAINPALRCSLPVGMQNHAELSMTICSVCTEGYIKVTAFMTGWARIPGV